MEWQQGSIVLATAGRDAGMYFAVVAADERFVWLANGKLRRAERPKRKKRRHTAYAGACDARTRQKLLETGRLTNSDIRKALDLWFGDNQN